VVAPGPKDEERLLYPEPGVEATESGGSARVLRVGGSALPYDPTYHLLGRMDKIRALVRREKPDVLEVHSPYLAMAAALSVPRADFGVRTFFWHADFIDTYLRVMLERRVSSRVADVTLAPLWRGVRAMASQCDATIVAGRWQRDKLEAHGVPNVELVPFGVERSVFRPEARSEERRRELVDARAKLFVGVGRFAVEKRWDVVLDAFIAVRARGVDATLVLFGDGPERAAMEARVAGRGDVKFMGFVTDRAPLASAFASADLLLHGCPYETFGLGVAEAMACALPVVVPDEGGACESVDLSCGATYRALDAEACAAAIEGMLRRAPADLRAKALDVAKRVTSVEAHFDGVIAIYERLLVSRVGDSHRSI
jgi:alpha-1,6-mannosyltransferase